MLRSDPSRPERTGLRTATLLAAAFGVLAAFGLSTACSHPLPIEPSCPSPPSADTTGVDVDVFRMAGKERRARHEREVARLRADLRQAEEAMIAIESGMRGASSRADAVSELAEARIAVERVQGRVPWRAGELREAETKLDDAEAQLRAGHTGSAVFFASRARRIAETLDEEGRAVEREQSTRFVKVSRLNVRAGPSSRHEVIGVLSSSTPVFPEREQGAWVLVRTVQGPVGWVHGSLLR